MIAASSDETRSRVMPARMYRAIEPTSSPRNIIIRCTDDAINMNPVVASSTKASASAPRRPRRSKSCQPEAMPRAATANMANRARTEPWSRTTI